MKTTTLTAIAVLGLLLPSGTVLAQSGEGPGGPPPVNPPPTTFTAFPAVPGVGGPTQFPTFQILPSPVPLSIEVSPPTFFSVPVPNSIDQSSVESLTYALAGQFAASHPTVTGATSNTSQGQVVRFVFSLQAGTDVFTAEEFVVLHPGGQADLVRIPVYEREGANQLAYELQETRGESQFSFSEAGPAGSASFTLHS